MQTLTVAESGFLYIFKCIGYYSGSCFYLLLYAAALIFLFKKGNEKEKDIFLYPGITLILTVYNPLTPVVINSLFDINKEYYRFIWLTPVVIILSYIAVKLIWRYFSKRGERTVALLALVLLLAGSGRFVYAEGYVPTTNNYKMPGEVIQTAEIIRRTSKVKYPRALCDYNLNMEIRQYDASILLTADRERYMAAVAGNITDEMLEADGYYQEKLLAMLVQEKRLSKPVLEEALESTNTEFIVLSKKSKIIDYLKDNGFSEAGDTESRLVLYRENPDAGEFELADYNDVWNAQKFFGIF